MAEVQSWLSIIELYKDVINHIFRSCCWNLVVHHFHGALRPRCIFWMARPTIDWAVISTLAEKIMVNIFVSCILKHRWFPKGRLVADLENQRKISALEGLCLLSCICHRGGKEFPATFKLIYKATQILLKYNTIYNMTLSWIPIVWEQQQCRPCLREAMAMRSQLSSSYFQSTGSIWKWPQSSISFYHKTKNSRTDCSKKLFQKPFLHGILRPKHPSLDVLQKKKWFTD